jgi:hypothetical protein
MHKRTKFLVILLGALVLVAVGLGIWAYATGKIKSSAATNPSIYGYATCSSDCSPNTGWAKIVNLYIKESSGAYRHVGQTDARSTDGYYYFPNLAGDTSYYVGGISFCGDLSDPNRVGGGRCESDYDGVYVGWGSARKDIMFKYDGNHWVGVYVRENTCKPGSHGTACIQASDGATVSVAGQSDTTYEGKVSFDVKSGTYQATISKPGYKTIVTKSFTLTSSCSSYKILRAVLQMK